MTEPQRFTAEEMDEYAVICFGYTTAQMIRQGASAERTLAALREELLSRKTGANANALIAADELTSAECFGRARAYAQAVAELDRLSAAAAYIEQLEKELEHWKLDAGYRACINIADDVIQGQLTQRAEHAEAELQRLKAQLATYEYEHRAMKDAPARGDRP